MNDDSVCNNIADMIKDGTLTSFDIASETYKIYTHIAYVERKINNQAKMIRRDGEIMYIDSEIENEKVCGWSWTTYEKDTDGTEHKIAQGSDSLDEHDTPIDLAQRIVAQIKDWAARSRIDAEVFVIDPRDSRLIFPSFLGETESSDNDHP